MLLPRDHSFGTDAKVSKKLTFLIPLICTLACTHQGVRINSFSKNFALNEWLSFLRLLVVVVLNFLLVFFSSMNFRVTKMELLNYNLLILVGRYQLEWSYPSTSDLFQEKPGFPKRLFEVTQSLAKFEVIQAIFWKIIKSFTLLWERRNFLPE